MTFRNLLLCCLWASSAQAEDSASFLPGIRVEAFVGDWPDLPDFDSLTPVATTTVDTIDLAAAPSADDYALRFHGTVQVREAGAYRFTTRSDDGSRLWIGGQLVVENGGTHGARERTGQVSLTVGKHDYIVEYHDAGGDESLLVTVEGPVLQVLGGSRPPWNHHLLWYDEPARDWVEALPIGNGRLGAMVFGGIEKERWQLSEDSLWPAAFDPRLDRGSPQKIEEYRKRLFEGDAAGVSSEIMSEFSPGRTSVSHQTLGDLWLEPEIVNSKVSSYARWLTLNEATTSMVYRDGRTAFAREVFSSQPHQVLAAKFTADDEHALRFRLSLTRPQDRGVDTATTKAELVSKSSARLTLQGELTQRGDPFGKDIDGNAFLALCDVHIDGGNSHHRRQCATRHWGELRGALPRR